MELSTDSKESPSQAWIRQELPEKSISLQVLSIQDYIFLLGSHGSKGTTCYYSKVSNSKSKQIVPSTKWTPFPCTFPISLHLHSISCIPIISRENEEKAYHLCAIEESGQVFISILTISNLNDVSISPWKSVAIKFDRPFRLASMPDYEYGAGCQQMPPANLYRTYTLKLDYREGVRSPKKQKIHKKWRGTPRKKGRFLRIFCFFGVNHLPGNLPSSGEIGGLLTPPIYAEEKKEKFRPEVQ